MSVKALPISLDAERFILASIMLDGTYFASAAASVVTEDFSIEAHRKVWDAMIALDIRGIPIERVTLLQVLSDRGELQAVGGFEFLNHLDEGIPLIPNISEYVRTLRDKSTLRKICFAAQKLYLMAAEPGAEPSEVLADAGAGLLKLSERALDSTLVTPGSIIESSGGIVTYLERGRRSQGVKSGFSDFDQKTGGFRPGGLYIIGARPRMGKTAWVLNVAEKIALPSPDVDPSTVLIFSLEMDKESLVDRMICSRARVNTKRFEAGALGFDESRRISRSAGEIASCDRILIDDKAVTNMHEIHSKIRQEKARRDVGLVVIDYLQLLIGGNEKYRVAEASKISRDMKLIGKDCKVPMLVLSQLSRACDERKGDHRPQLSDLRESGGLEQDADLVGFIFREEIYEQNREDLRGLAELIIAKQRSGPESTVPLVWLKEIVRFEERAQ